MHKTYLRCLATLFFFELVAGGGGFNPYSLEIEYQTVPGGITVNTVVYEYDIQDGETAGIEVVNLARRGTAATGSYGKYAVHAQRIGGSTTLSTASTSFNSASYVVGVLFAVSGTKVQVICTIAGGIPINHKGFIKVFKI